MPSDSRLQPSRNPAGNGRAPAGSGALYLTAMFLPISLAFGNRIELGLFSLTIGEIGAFLFILAAAAHSLHEWRLPRAVAALAVAAVCSTLIAFLRTSDSKHFLSTTRDLFEPLLLSWALIATQARGRAVSRMVWLYIAGAAGVAFLGLGQFFLGLHYPFQPEVNSSWAQAKIASIQSYVVAHVLGLEGTIANGTYPGPNLLGEYLFGALVLLSALLVCSREVTLKKRHLLPLGAAWLVLTVGLAVTFSRTTALMFLVALPLLLAARRGRLTLTKLVVTAIAVTALVGVLIGLGIVGGLETASIFGRGQTLQSAIKLMQDYPSALFGGATQLYLGQYYIRGQLVHNAFLYLMLHFGIVLALAYYALGFSTVLACAARSRNEPRGFPRAVAGGAAVAVFLLLFLYGQTAPYVDFVQSGLNLAFIASLGIVSSMRAPFSVTGAADLSPRGELS